MPLHSHHNLNGCAHHELPYYPEVTCQMRANLQLCKMFQNKSGAGERNGAIWPHFFQVQPVYRFTPTPNASYTGVISPCYTPVIQASLYALACITLRITCYTAVIPAGFRMYVEVVAAALGVALALPMAPARPGAGSSCIITDPAACPGPVQCPPGLDQASGPVPVALRVAVRILLLRAMQ